jgi:predicted glycoside hydrolase/deacetylase ChbG (UPF0249 family)
MPASIPLLVCADDFGYSDAVDSGIAQLVATGRVSATSCLTSSPRWLTAAPLARSLRDRADLGLHLDLTEFARLAGLPRLLLTARLGLLDRRQIAERISTQLARFEDTIGAAPDYVDGHQHVHQLPAVATPLLEELQRRYAGRLPWVRVSLPVGRDFKSRLIAATGAAALRRALDLAGFRRTRRLLGVYDFGATPPYAQRFAAWLGMVQPGDALMVHPAATALASDALGAAREREFAALRSPQAGELLAAAHVFPARGASLHSLAAA